MGWQSETFPDHKIQCRRTIRVTRGTTASYTRNPETTIMTKALPIASLLFVYTVAGSALLPGASHASDVMSPAVRADSTWDAGHRGTRPPLVTNADAQWNLDDKPRRGERSNWQQVSRPMLSSNTEAGRRGAR